MTNKRVAPPMGCHSLSIDWKKMLQAARTDEGRNICSAYFFENIVLSFYHFRHNFTACPSYLYTPKEGYLFFA